MRTSDVPCSRLPFSYILGEVMELLAEVRHFSLEGIRDEACDVYTCSHVFLYQRTGIDTPVIWKRSALAWQRRVQVWKEIFEKEGLTFKQEYLAGGANFNKPEKVAQAIELARADQG